MSRLSGWRVLQDKGPKACGKERWLGGPMQDSGINFDLKLKPLKSFKQRREWISSGL